MNLKAIEDNYKDIVYGKCCKCDYQFQYGDKIFSISEMICASSQGQPDIFKKETNRYCKDCISFQTKEVTKKCNYENCQKEGEFLACGRDNNPLLYCEIHAEVMADEGNPEYKVSCPSCGCGFGVN